MRRLMGNMIQQDMDSKLFKRLKRKNQKYMLQVLQMHWHMNIQPDMHNIMFYQQGNITQLNYQNME